MNILLIMHLLNTNLIMIYYTLTKTDIQEYLSQYANTTNCFNTDIQEYSSHYAYTTYKPDNDIHEYSYHYINSTNFSHTYL